MLKKINFQCCGKVNWFEHRDIRGVTSGPQRLRPSDMMEGVLTEVQMKPGRGGGGSRGRRQTVMKQQCDPAVVTGAKGLLVKQRPSWAA